MDNPFENWLRLQLQLQINAYDQDPRALEGEARTGFLLWNSFAATDEIHEAMQEVGWKPWASSRHVNEDLMLGELVDALHFVGNMVLAAAGQSKESPEQLASKLWRMYQAKVQVNLQRQVDGYDGIKDKCPICKRELIGKPRMCAEHGEVSASIQSPDHN